MPYQENVSEWAAGVKQFELTQEINAMRGAKNMPPLTKDEEQEIHNALALRYQQADLKKLDFNEIEQINISDITKNAYGKFGPAPAYVPNISLSGLIGAGGLAGEEALRSGLEADVVSQQTAKNALLKEAALIEQAGQRTTGNLAKNAIKGVGSAGAKTLDWLANWDEKIAVAAEKIGEKITANSIGKSGANAAAAKVAGKVIRGAAGPVAASVGSKGVPGMYAMGVVPVPKIQSLTSLLPGYAGDDEKTIWSQPSNLLSREGWGGQLVDQYSAATMPGGTYMEKNYGGTDPFGLRPAVDFVMDSAGLSGRNSANKNNIDTAVSYFDDLMEDSEYTDLNPISSSIYKSIDKLNIGPKPGEEKESDAYGFGL